MAINEELSARMKEALEAACFSDQDVQTVLHTYFDPEFSETVDGQMISRSAFAEQIQFIRSVTVNGSVTVKDSYLEGSGFAHHHVLTMQALDGSTVDREVFMFGTRAEDGRFLQITESSRDIHGAEPV